MPISVLHAIFEHMTTLAYIPSPSISQFHVGSLTIHIYALTMLLGIIAAVWITGERWKRLGGTFDQIFDTTWWRYHVASSVHASTTSSPLRSVSSARMATGLRCSAYGTAVSASGAPSYAAHWAHGHGAAISIIRWRCWRIPLRLRCLWLRRSVALATGSIRSCTASPPRCHGGSSSTRTAVP